jgi:Protein of unknown function (DUF2946)
VQAIRRLFRQATWLAIFAMLGLALAPTVSHALAASGPGNPWAEICSVAGGKLVVADAAGAQADSGTHLGHCPLCGQTGGAPALPSAVFVPLRVDGAEHRPAVFSHAPRPLFAWAAAQPRAPPSAC